LDVQFLVGIPANIRTWVWSTAGQRPFGNEPFLDFLMNVSTTVNGIQLLNANPDPKILTFFFGA